MQDRKKIFLHIGHYKTGSSAIQYFLSNHEADLNTFGFSYPSCNRPKNNPTNHGHLSLSLGRDHGFMPPPWYNQDVTSDAAYNELRDNLKGNRFESIILSSEEFVQLALRGNFDAALQDLKARLSDYDVTIIFYSREPLSLLKSWYNELNKAPNPTRTFLKFMMNVHAGFLSQKNIWDRYAKHFGIENMRMRRYQNHGAAHIQDFLTAVGCPYQVTTQPEPRQEGQPITELEKLRFAKAAPQNRWDFYTTTQGFSLTEFLQRIEAISSDYRTLNASIGEDAHTNLTAQAVVHHYGELLKHVPHEQRNQKEANVLRDLGVEAEKLNDIPLALAFMQIAHLIRPHGPVIFNKLNDYRHHLGLDPLEQPSRTKNAE